jgi:UDP-N-acetylglucosamine--N-acetylmuramyl-(pentapeptide) pyrophosphoryl-undecaprenol N-acetylglucosamine transferase
MGIEATGTGMSRTYIFAGGGTGGHLYPAIAVAQQITRLDPDAKVMFLCSNRPIDASILSGAGYEHIPLPAKGLSLRPDRLAGFVVSQIKACRAARRQLAGLSGEKILISVGGFASAPAVWAARRLGMPITMINVDIVPGKANKLLARLASKIFVQFEDTRRYFKGRANAVVVTGCPLRDGFSRPDRRRAIEQLRLDPAKRTLLVTGASSGSASINQSLARIVPTLDDFARTWQVVHLTGKVNFEQVKAAMPSVKIAYYPVAYYDDMPDLYAVADLLVGRAGAVSVAEYLAAGVPSLCLPYPYHKDRHQYLNAEPLVQKGAGRIIDDRPQDPQRTARDLGEQLRELMADDARRTAMRTAARSLGRLDAAAQIAATLRGMLS